MLRAAGARRAGPDAELSFDCRPTVGARFDDGGLRGEMAADARSVTALGPPRLESARASETSSRRWTEGGASMLRAAGARRAGPDAELSFDCRPTVGGVSSRQLPSDVARAVDAAVEVEDLIGSQLVEPASDGGGSPVTSLDEDSRPPCSRAGLRFHPSWRGPASSPASMRSASAMIWMRAS